MEENISKNEIVSNALLKKAVKLVSSLACMFRNAPIMPIKPVYNTKTGNIKVIARMRVTTRNLNGFVADTSMASICSVTFMEPNSAPILEPTLPAAIKAVTNGANALMIAMDISEGNHELAPKVDKEGRDCLVKTIPVIKPVKETSGKYL